MTLTSPPDQDRTYALAAAVDADGVGSAWSCILDPGDAQATADALQPANPDVTITSSEVNENVVRTELEVSARSSSGPLPPEAGLITRFPETPHPGF